MTISKNIEYLLAVLNSKIITFYHFNNSAKATKGLFPKLILADVKEFPIPDISEQKQQPFIELVNQILQAKENNPEADTSLLEQEIDNLVYKLYQLTDEEISIIEKEINIIS